MSKTSNSVLLFVTAVVLPACAHIQADWRSSTGATPSQLQKDAADCQFRATLASLPGIFAGKEEHSGVSDLEQMCMNAKGYYQVEKKWAGEFKVQRDSAT
jgi:hypothetical protein